MSKKISSATIEEIIKANKKENTKVLLHTKDAEIEVIINPNQSYQERTQMVSDIADYCYDEFGNYHPEFFDMAYKIGLIENFTNINTDTKDSVNKLHILCDCTNIIQEIENVLGDSANQIHFDAKDICEWRNQQSIKSSAWDDVAISISHLLDKLEEKIDKFAETNPEDIEKLTGLANKLGGISEEKILGEVLKFRTEENKE